MLGVGIDPRVVLPERSLDHQQLAEDLVRNLRHFGVLLTVLMTDSERWFFTTSITPAQPTEPHL
jgi:hypothetical protein